MTEDEKRTNKEVANENDKGEEMESWSEMWTRVVEDVKNKDLIHIKILYFFKYATLFVLYPFMTLHMKSLGITPEQTGINSAFIPIVAIIGPPLSGIIADKIGNFKVVLAVITLLNGFMALSLLLIPVAVETVVLPKSMSFHFACERNASSSNENFFVLRSLQDSTCLMNPNHILPLTPLKCGIFCDDSTDTREDFLTGSAAHNIEEQKGDLICDGDKRNCFIGFSDKETTKVEIEIENVQQLSGNGSSQLFKLDKSLKFGNMNFTQVPNCMAPSQSLNQCNTDCLVAFERSLLCTNSEEKRTYNVALTFWLYTFLRIVLGFGSATSFIMFEGAVLASLKEFGGDYGIQKISGVLAGIIVTPISGALISVYGFTPAFYFYAILQTISALLTLNIDLAFKKPGDKVLRHLKQVLSKLEILIFFFSMLVAGTAWGYLESFLFWYLEDLGGSKVLFGLTVSVGGLAGIPFLIVSGPIIKKLGHVNVLCLGLLFYSIRLMGYSLIGNPWLCLVFEALEAITSSLALTAAATYAAALSTEQTIASIQGIMGGMYFGIGRATGSLIGGFLIGSYGHRNSLQVFALGSLVASVVYYFVNLFYIRHHSIVSEGIDLLNMKGKKEEVVGYDGPLQTSPFNDIPLDEISTEEPQNKIQNGPAGKKKSLKKKA